MKSALSVFFLTVLGTSLALPQAATTPAKKKTAAAKSPVSTTSIHKSSTKTISGKTSAASRKGKSSTKRSSPARAAPTRQSAPTPERYKEIQQALAEKGYLKSEPNGVWDADSADALRQFQTDKNLTPTGKITAASLIGLGLGPKQADTMAVKPPAAADPAGAAPAAPAAN
ncbi:MAG TPA: peptidoglycan-binding domain-containing protein [Bryobacteraceae bacterium]|jgi:hypothetical protein|nr:peptidoglycan-binding domain-containing protein [Bryobacteraceae bacterium]